MSDLLTKRSVADIQHLIWLSLGGGSTECIPNVSYGFFKEKGMEADLVYITPYGYLHEFEIKRSKSDFLADFKKPVFHGDVRIQKLTFVLPEALAGEWLKQWCADHYKEFRRSFDFWFYPEEGMLKRPNYYGVDPKCKYTREYYFTDEMVREIDENDRDLPYRRRLFAEERSELYRLCMIRYWNNPRKVEVKTAPKEPEIGLLENADEGEGEKL